LLSLLLLLQNEEKKSAREEKAETNARRADTKEKKNWRMC